MPSWYNFLGQIPLSQGDNDAAARLFSQGLDAARRVPDRFPLLISLYDLALSSQARETWPARWDSCEEGLSVASDAGDESTVGYYLAARWRHWPGSGTTRPRRPPLAAADALLQAAGTGWLLAYAATAPPDDETLPGLRSRIGDATFQQAWSQGAADGTPACRGIRATGLTGSTDGLGRAAAGVLISEGHDVILHARTRERAAALSDLAADAAGVVVGDLSSAAETRELAGQVNQIGRMDAVIHNAGVFLEPSRAATAEGHAKTLAVNTLAPYMLTALIGRPDRLIYLSSGLHHAGAGSLRDIDWTSRSWNAAQAYSESKLHVTALALTLARVWPEVLSNAVDPGWVPTKMGGPGQPAICRWAISRRHGSPSAMTPPPP